MLINSAHYESLRTLHFPDNENIDLIDHLGGFDATLKNLVLDVLVARKFSNTIYLQYCVDPILKNQYKTIDIKFSTRLQDPISLAHFNAYNIHPDINYKNFICSFNGSAHVSRKLLVAIIHRFGWFDPQYSSKNFVFSSDVLNGHIFDIVQNQERFWSKFFIDQDTEEFFQTKYSFGHERYDHGKNIYTLENRLTESFLQIVSETMATSYYPFVTEKFLYSVVTRGLFLSYAQPGWHSHVEKYYGFKKYTKLFDYRFDNIKNPVERLVELITMISKFSILSTDDWVDLYLLEQDTIEFNYDHYFSGNYLTKLEQTP